MKNVHPIQPRDQIRAEARAWVLKFNSDMPPGPEDIRAMRKWSEISPVHRQELERAENFWLDADALSELAVPTGRAQYKKKLRQVTQFLRSVLPVNSVTGGAITAVFLLSFVIWLAVPYSNTGNGTYSTAIGEQITLTLADESQIQLDTNTELRINYSAEAREIYLLRGKVHFAVAKNPHRPFEVYAGDGMVRAVGTAFSVYLSGRDVEVMVDEGRVELAHVSDAVLSEQNNMTSNRQSNKSKDVFLSLDKGQGASFNRDYQQVRELAQNDLSRELAWRRGLLIFTGDPLSEVVTEVNRYTSTQIEISDPELGKLEIGGRFRVGELEALFDVLQAGFGVEVSYLNDNHIELRSSSK